MCHIPHNFCIHDPIHHNYESFSVYIPHFHHPIQHSKMFSRRHSVVCPHASLTHVCNEKGRLSLGYNETERSGFSVAEHNELHGGRSRARRANRHISIPVLVQTVNRQAPTTLQQARGRSRSPHNALHSLMILWRKTLFNCKICYMYCSAVKTILLSPIRSVSCSRCKTSATPPSPPSAGVGWSGSARACCRSTSSLSTS